jgi:hypothetical protein
MFTCMQVLWYVYTLCVRTAHIHHQDLWNIQRFLPPTLSFVIGFFFIYIMRRWGSFCVCEWVYVYTAYETNESKIIWAYCKGILKKTWISPYNRPRRLRGGLEVLLYSFFNLGARRGWVVNATSLPLYLRKGEPVTIVQVAGWATGQVSIPLPSGQ